MLPRVTATAYLAPLREGGSLPGLVEADDDGTYVVKFTGAGQGPKALVAEIVVAEIARAIGLSVPELKLIEIDAELGRREPDEEVQELLVKSAGTNLAVDFLPGSQGYDRRAFSVDRETASSVRWLDAYVANVDRSARNTNLLVWHGRLWLIDHGACLWFHHAWASIDAFADSAYRHTGHVLDGLGDPRSVQDRAAAVITEPLLAAALAQVPDAWLEPDPTRPDPRAPATAREARATYLSYLTARLRTSEVWLS